MLLRASLNSRISLISLLYYSLANYSIVLFNSFYNYTIIITINKGR